MRPLQPIASTMAVAVWLALSTLTTPTWSQPWPDDASGQAPRMAVQDVVLGPGGSLVARVLDRAGMPLTGFPVTMSDGTRVVASVVTAPDGSFCVRGVPNGTYTVSVAGGRYAYRLWNGGSGPSRATRLALIVADGPVVRGQYPAHDVGMGYVRTPRHISRNLYDMIEEHPVITYTVLTAAIVIPIVVVNQEDD